MVNQEKMSFFMTCNKKNQTTTGMQNNNQQLHTAFVNSIFN